MLKRALRTFRDESLSTEEEIRWLWTACLTAYELWDYEAWPAFSVRLVQLTRDAGALIELAVALDSLAMATIFVGDFASAASFAEEGDAISEVTGSQPMPYHLVFLAACRGDEATASELIERVTDEVVRRGEGMGLVVVQWASAFIYTASGALRRRWQRPSSAARTHLIRCGDSPSSSRRHRGVACLTSLPTPWIVSSSGAALAVQIGRSASRPVRALC